ncbi:tRNA (guanosine(18)-2'-O)-methyltransferase [Fulvitalea axinellae]|uniref:tRNA (guanosine(18)-2'-O)-methyltransferase n=1 Tax=Fulvitalea axinellae TaxID=1182444 RepID=A0AAU9CIP0_9BACT|nr:tRNA (guanosine(18)-2'-O)-methyltransferase [Fulvitalea axinellae]
MEEKPIGEYEKGLMEFFRDYVTENKQSLIENALNERTRYVTAVVENIYKSQNASAVLRTCDCFGVHDFHIVEDSPRYKMNPNVSKGAGAWVNIHRYDDEAGDNTEVCYERLKSEGYKIYATSPHASGVPIERVPLDSKVAVVFGNEHSGLSQKALDMADGYITLPMYGFTESFNISVTASICLHNLVNRLRETDVDWHLSQKEKDAIRYRWYRRVVRKAEALERRYREEKGLL